MNVLAFADTSGVRFEVRTPNGAALTGATVIAKITSTADRSVLWRGTLGTLADSAGTAKLVKRVDGLRPRLWSPESPSLYLAEVNADGPRGAGAQLVRFGFRTIRAENGRIVLNGRPVFLRGNAINPPGRNLPDSLDDSPRFALEYMRFMKAHNVNIIRLTEPNQTWFDAADSAGMLIFQGHYGTPRGGTSTSPPKDTRAALRWYRDSVVAPQANHPSVVIYALSNEQSSPDIHYLSKNNAAVTAFLQTAYDTLSRWDDTRLYIGNAGYGFGRAGNVCDLHRYWGWYYNSFLSFYTLRDPKICWRSSAMQPMTLTENTGNYTGPDGRFNLASDTKQPDSQLNWTGHAPEAEQSARALAYQAWMAGQAIEITRRLRERNPSLSGLSPFTIAFANWHRATGVADLGAKPVVAQYARSYQPVLLSWESWTPNVYAGSTIHPVAHVVNDDTTGRALRGVAVRWTLLDSAGTVRASGTQPFGDVAYYAATSRAVPVALPAALPTGTYTLAGALLRGADTVSRNDTRLFVAARGDAGAAGETGTLARRVRVYDPSGRTTRALVALGLAPQPVTSIGALDPRRDALVVGAGSWDARLADDSAALRTFVERGGRAVILEQTALDAAWLPGGLRVQTSALDHPLVFPGGRPFAQGMAINPERPAHPVFDGLSRDRFFLWSDHTGWDESKPGFPAVYPVTHGLAVTRPAELGRVALLADYDHGLEGVALAECFVGDGSVLVSGFDVVPRVGRDPVADRFLRNLVRYAAGDLPHEPQVRVAPTVTWGDYASERGAVVGIQSGLLLNTVPVVPRELGEQYPVHVDSLGFWFAGSSGGWNTRPAIQYVGRGRRPFGPYGFTSGGSVQLAKDAGPLGEGRVWLRAPDGTRAMVTTVENPAPRALALEITVNGARSVCPVGANATARCETPVSSPDLALTFRGDRRLVLRETAFQ
ncbi:glycoside hydrolase family 2 TIM barrel (plasmid) [Gemmatirosa kalamazoonensis]|uniref:Glycoside hydrolase family 2 TIM barrel n=1 Tax=Gemmatirosa kalamazoonensis TaxID=861299 RepID=W0RPP2_9BACT|nr:glycoside hydrolase family 2 TIM barrel-domain containing protein [Gemmatirosa kalamazoonensis]AHG92974.1 glycoside hydrolase family 2 TIM barrel [Gemmatirosa kalamazoonensis]